MDLIVDVGNSRVKAFVVDQEKELLVAHTELFTVALLEDVFSQYPQISRAIVSAVGKSEDEPIEWLKQRVPTIVLDHNTSIPIKVLYHTPNTIGVDRLATAVGASKLYPCKDVLIIDLGTAITIDYLSSEAEFLGGNISPGMYTRFKSLNQLTHKLPLVEPEQATPHMGRTTTEAIRAGVQNGITYELQGYVNDFFTAKPKGVVIFTGGDANFFAKTIKYPIFVIFNLAVIGLHTILEYNAATTN